MSRPATVSCLSYLDLPKAEWERLTNRTLAVLSIVFVTAIGHL